jgi:hypothetical protein
MNMVKTRKKEPSYTLLSSRDGPTSSHKADDLRHEHFFGASEEVATAFDVLRLLVTKARINISSWRTPRMTKRVSKVTTRLPDTNRATSELSELLVACSREALLAQCGI